MDTLRYASPDDVETAFYEALEKGDLEAMMALWAEDDEILCIHPGGQRLSGHGQVRHGWQEIFSVMPSLSAQVGDRQSWQSALTAVHSLTETYYPADGQELPGDVVVTHIYVRGADGWRLLARHASMAPEEDILAGDTPRTLH